MSMNLRFWLIIMVLGGAGMGLHFLSHGEAVPIEKPLASLPLDLGEWHGRDLELDPRLVKAVGVDDHLSRVYEDHAHVPLVLYVGYYRSQRTGQWVHSPKNCLPGAGWEPVTSTHVMLAGPSGQPVPVNEYVIENGLQRQFVLYWYQSHGRIVASEYWGKIYLVLDALRLNRTDTALVRVSLPITGIQDSVKERDSLKFAQDLIAQLGDVLPK